MGIEWQGLMRVEKMTYSVFKVVNWLRVKNNAELRVDPNAEELTQTKAMKLLYYIKLLVW